MGVSNYGVHHLDELEGYIKELEEKNGKGKGGKISVGQWEVHPWLERQDIVEWCAERGVVVEVCKSTIYLLNGQLTVFLGIQSACERNQIRRTEPAGISEEISKDASASFDPLEFAEGEKQFNSMLKLLVLIQMS